MVDIVAIGEPMIEFNQARSTDPHTYLQGFGGDTSNMAIAAARLGARVAYVTRLGADSFGRMFIDLWSQGRFPFDRLLTFYPFAEIARAFEDSHSGKAIKPVLLMEGTA